MSKKLKFLLKFLLVLSFGLTCYGQKWLGKIVPLQTNFSQVREMFNITPKQTDDDELFFKLKEGNLFISFSQGNCIEDAWGKRWNVNKETVLNITFYPAKERKRSYYNLKEEGMKKDFNQGYQLFTNDELGLHYDVEFGKVRSINFYAPSKYQNLLCVDSNSLS